MPESRESLEDLVLHPTESFTIELKSWIDPGTPHGQSKIVKAALALRNQDGGFVIIGFDDTTHLPVDDHMPPDPRVVWHGDTIQGLVARYSSEPFEVTVDFVPRDGRLHPVITIPAGLKTPVVAKGDLRDAENRLLVQRDAVYVRTLASNNTVSTAIATGRDWGPLIERCFNNREADIGAFFRRQLTGPSAETILRSLGALAPVLPEANRPLTPEAFLEPGRTALGEALRIRGTTLPSFGSWEAAVQICGDFPQRRADADLLTLLDLNNPGYTGWPVWVDSRAFTNPEFRPYVRDGGWEALIFGESAGHHDFWRIHPSGYFYLWRALQDDVAPSRPTEEPGRYLDFALVILRVTEALAVPLHFARALGCVPEQTKLSFAFRWSHLQGRELASWANPGRRLSVRRVSRDNEVLSQVEIPLTTPETALAPFVAEATAPLFNSFEGWMPAPEVFEDLAGELVGRRVRRR